MKPDILLHNDSRQDKVPTDGCMNVVSESDLWEKAFPVVSSTIDSAYKATPQFEGNFHRAEGWTGSYLQHRCSRPRPP